MKKQSKKRKKRRKNLERFSMLSQKNGQFLN